MTVTSRHPAATAARAALGRQLAARRRAANLTQHQLSVRTHFERSTIANVEVGRSAGTLAFWEACDRVLPELTTLVSAYLQYRQDIDAIRDSAAPPAWSVPAGTAPLDSDGPHRWSQPPALDDHDPSDRPRLRLVPPPGSGNPPSPGPRRTDTVTTTGPACAAARYDHPDPALTADPHTLWNQALVAELSRIRLTIEEARWLTEICSPTLVPIADGNHLHAEVAETLRRRPQSAPGHARRDDPTANSPSPVDGNELLLRLAQLGPTADYAIRAALAQWHARGGNTTAAGFAAVGLHVLERP